MRRWRINKYTKKHINIRKNITMSSPFQRAFAAKSPLPNHGKIQKKLDKLNKKYGDTDFYEREDGTSRIASRPIKGNKKQINTYSLDDYMDLTNVPNCKLIKIDVEGHEYEVLEGAKNMIEKFKPFILIETFKSKRPKLNDWCEQNNYHSTWLRGDDFLLSPP